MSNATFKIEGLVTKAEITARWDLERVGKLPEMDSKTFKGNCVEIDIKGRVERWWFKYERL